MSSLRFTLLTLICATSLRAVSVAPLFTDHAVLQQGAPVPVWGKGHPGEDVTVTFGSQVVHATVDVDRNWRATLAPLAASDTPADLVVVGKNTITLTDILVGEVWLCSGQSNMEFPFKWAAKTGREASTTNHPLIRHFGVTKSSSATPLDTVKGDWRICTPNEVREFTAVGYFFARELQQTLNVPIGLVNASYGGTPVEAWMSDAGLKSDPAFSVVFDRITKITQEWPATMAKYRADSEAWKKAETEAKAAGKKFTTPKPRQPIGPSHPYMPRMTYNAMLRPLVPYAIRGTIWYQGEGNSTRASEYHRLFSALITQWRAEWAQGEFPFYFVQLANFKADDPQGTQWAFLREAQTKTLSVANTGMAVTIDIGDPNDVHPRNKQDVGRRLARLALARTYGKKDVIDSGPIFEQADFKTVAPSVRVEFQKSPATLENNNPDNAAAVLGFELAGADRVFHPADAQIDRDVVIVKSSAVPAPIAVRYAWRNAPVATLRNSAGLPAVPFRSDNW
jgi:sialate O-acetylesterase